MALITVPKPPKSAYNPDRPMSSLLKSQIEHLREAESKLPLKYRSELYIKAVRTEGEAAQYIREVTEAIHKAHNDAQRARQRSTGQRSTRKTRVIEIAAAADERSQRKEERARRKRSPKRNTSGRKRAKK